MNRTLKILTLAVTVAIVSAPAVARADGYISPFAGTNFGTNSGNGRLNVGVDAGWMGGGVIGAEAEFGYAPNFFGNTGSYGSNSVTDVMGNLIVGIPVGGTSGAGVRPYFAIGAGLLRSQVNGATSTAASISNNELGMNAGVGLMGYFSHHVGIRGDVRYFRNVTDNSSANNLNLNIGAFHFWRASIGIVLRP